jgi:hypothetical protein
MEHEIMVTDIIIKDESAVEEAAIVQTQKKDSIQDFPDITKNEGGPLRFGARTMFQRDNLLAPRGTYRRLEQQRSWYYAEGAELFRSAVTGLVKRIQSMPYEIKAPEEDGDTWDKWLRYAGLSSWETFISHLIVNYSIYDLGAFIEIIAPGDPKKPPVGPATGMAVLDTRRICPTGDPVYPFTYTSMKGRVHLLHKTRVIQIVDTEEKNDDLPNWGDSAVGRAITTTYREMLASGYMRSSLDDKPSPGFAIAKNLTEQHVYQQLEKMENKRENDRDVMGRVVFLWGAAAEHEVKLDWVTFQKEFTGFDPEKLSNLNAKYFAAAIGVDIQDFWELTGQGIGTATQSEILAQKSKGRALGRLLKAIERAINDILPVDVEFTFLYRNEEEDLQNAQTANTWVQAIEGMTTITADERRIMYANQIPAVKDAITDNKGQVIRWDDSDPQTEEQADDAEDILDTGEEEPQAESAPDENLETGEQKDFRKTRREFINTFNGVIDLVQSGVSSPRTAGILISDQLRRSGRETILDGVKRSGKRRPAFTDEMQRELSTWLARQQPLIRSFINNVEAGNFTDKQLVDRGLLWSNKSLEELLYKGMVLGKPKKLWKWRINTRKENCKDCLRLNGQVHLMQTYIKSGYTPKSPILECKGFECGCRLSAVKPGTKAKGRIRGVKRKGHRHVH